MQDPYFRVEVLARTEQPQTCCWFALHQDYCEEYTFDADPPPESACGNIIRRRLLGSNRGHFGPLEHPSITFAVGYFPHSVMQQARTHRVGVSFDVQSMRYTGSRICAVARGDLDIEKVFYLRPVGDYRDRQGKRYTYTNEMRNDDLHTCRQAACAYEHNINYHGFAEEHARGILPFDFRQHFVVSFNLRSALHFMDLRSKADAQWEIRALCDLLWPHLQAWAPEVCYWYADHRLHKALLAP